MAGKGGLNGTRNRTFNYFCVFWLGFLILSCFVFFGGSRLWPVYVWFSCLVIACSVVVTGDGMPILLVLVVVSSLKGVMRGFDPGLSVFVGLAMVDCWVVVLAVAVVLCDVKNSSLPHIEILACMVC